VSFSLIHDKSLACVTILPFHDEDNHECILGKAPKFLKWFLSSAVGSW